MTEEKNYLDHAKVVSVNVQKKEKVMEEEKKEFGVFVVSKNNKVRHFTINCKPKSEIQAYKDALETVSTNWRLDRARKERAEKKVEELQEEVRKERESNLKLLEKEQRIKQKQKQIKKQIARYDIYDCMSIANGTTFNACVKDLIEKKYINENAAFNKGKYSNCKWQGEIQEFAVFCKVVAYKLFFDDVKRIFPPFLNLFSKNKFDNQKLSEYALKYDIKASDNQKFLGILKKHLGDDCLECLNKKKFVKK